MRGAPQVSLSPPKIEDPPQENRRSVSGGMGARGLKASSDTSSIGRPLHPGSVRCYNHAAEVDWVGIMRALRATTKAALAFHRWPMKYGGTTMIIDNIEERRRWFNRSGIGVN